MQLRTGTDNLSILNQVARQPMHVQMPHASVGGQGGYEGLNTSSVWRRARSQAAAKEGALVTATAWTTSTFRRSLESRQTEVD